MNLKPTSTPGEAGTASMRTGELARRAGVNVETLRYYERRGLLPEPARRPSGHREYPPEALERMRAIKRAQRLGFTLAEIERLLGPRGRRPTLEVQATAAAKLVELEERLQDMQDMRAELRVLVDLDCDALVGCKCDRAECPVAHDHRVARAEASLGIAPDDVGVETHAPATGQSAAGGLAGRAVAVAAAVACLACLAPLLGVGALATGMGDPALNWEVIERFGFVVAAILGAWLVLRRRTTGSGGQCGRCGSAPHATSGG